MYFSRYFCLVKPECKRISAQVCQRSAPMRRDGEKVTLSRERDTQRQRQRDYHGRTSRVCRGAQTQRDDGSRGKLTILSHL